MPRFPLWNRSGTGLEPAVAREAGGVTPAGLFSLGAGIASDSNLFGRADSDSNFENEIVVAVIPANAGIKYAAATEGVRGARGVSGLSMRGSYRATDRS